METDHHSLGDQAPVRVCCYEDRPEAFATLMLMGESLCRSDPEGSLHLTVPNASPAVLEWAERISRVTITTEPLAGLKGWDVKPQILLAELRAGRTQVLWLDSDLIVTRPLSVILSDFPPETLLAAEDWYRPAKSTFATTSWGLPAARAIHPLNSCFIRVTPIHRELLESWREMLTDPRYREAQAQPFSRRPFHLEGDQLLLSALLGSEKYGHVDFDTIKLGRHIAHCAGLSGYRPRDRMASLVSGLPPLIHCCGRKPWNLPRTLGRWTRFLFEMENDVSPYVLAARPIARSLDIRPDWIDARTPIGRFFRLATGHHPVLAGLPLALVHSLRKALCRGPSVGHSADLHDMGSVRSGRSTGG